jgi:hypothetical protein
LTLNNIIIVIIVVIIMNHLEQIQNWVPEPPHHRRRRRQRTIQFDNSCRATVTIFGSSKHAGVETYDQFVDIVQKTLYEWQSPIGCIIITDTLDPHTRRFVDQFATDTHIHVAVVRGDWESFGAAAEMSRDQNIVLHTTHAIAFAVQAYPADARLFRRMFREAIQTVKVE